MANTIPLKVKRECCRMKQEGLTARQIYEDYYKEQFSDPCDFSTFTRSLRRWVNRIFPDSTTLDCGTYEGFVAHGATVQVSKTGEIVQAWIKQKVSDIDIDDLVKALRENIEPYKYTRKQDETADRMLEIPLFDMHFGVSFLNDYEDALNDILELIRSRHWDQIIIPFGQDFFHNDSVVNGTTTKGTLIERVDMLRAVKEGRQFIVAIIDAALENSNNTYVVYSPGNHDRSVSWMFMQVLLERYGGEVVDDTMEYRKVFTYGLNAIMVTHGDSKQATARNLAHIFPISYPKEFGQSKTREVHSGHLHHETEADIYGVMVRRLSSGVAVDDWSNRQDFIGTHRRFMIFEWGHDSLRSIYYV